MQIFMENKDIREITKQWTVLHNIVANLLPTKLRSNEST